LNEQTPFPPVKPKKPLLINGFFIFSFATELSAHMGTHFYSWGALVLHSNLGFCHFGLYHATKSIFLPSFLADFLGFLPLVSSASSTSFVGWLETCPTPILRGFDNESIFLMDPWVLFKGRLMLTPVIFIANP
jgi:hypothetical protein